MANTQIKYQIGLSGWCGTGTSTAAKLICERLGNPWKRVSPASEHFRSLAAARYPDLPKGEGLNRLEKEAQSDLSIDRSCDDKLAEMAKSGEFFVADARLAGMLLPQGLRVYLHCESMTRYKRVSEREGKSAVQAANETIFREEASLARYAELYGVTDLATQCEFHLVLDSGKLAPDEICDLVVAKFYQLAA